MGWNFIYEKRFPHVFYNNLIVISLIFEMDATLSRLYFQHFIQEGFQL